MADDMKLISKVYSITNVHRRFYRMLRQEQGLDRRQAHWAFIGACFQNGWDAYDFGRLWMHGPMLKQHLNEEASRG